MIHYQQNIIPKWLIDGHDLYFIDDKNVLRNINTGKEIKKQLKGYTIGYYLNGSFKSLSQLRPLLRRYEKPKLPF